MSIKSFANNSPAYFTDKALYTKYASFCRFVEVSITLHQMTTGTRNDKKPRGNAPFPTYFLAFSAPQHLCKASKAFVLYQQPFLLYFDFKHSPT